MEIEYVSYKEKPFSTKDLMRLYKGAGWWDERAEQDLERMLERVTSIGAWKEDELIGFARAVSDDKFRAYIEDVVIHQQYQHAGIGTKLVETLLYELKDIDIISLFCEENLIPFYVKNKFKASRSQFVMHRKSLLE